MLTLTLSAKSLEQQDRTLNTLGRSLAEHIRQNGSISSAALNSNQVAAFSLARHLAEHRAAAALLAYARKAGEFEQTLAELYVTQSHLNLTQNILSCHADYGFTDVEQFGELLELAGALSEEKLSERWSELGKKILERDRDFSGIPGLDDTHAEFKGMFARFSDEVIAPIAEKTHREDEIIADEILNQLAELGVFGISIPEEYGGIFSDHLVMVIATEELSRGSLGAGGSVLTRPEICAKALLAGGTEEQKKRWLPVIAAGEKMVCIAVTEPNTGSDVANVSVTATRSGTGYLINGEKTWATFAGRSEILCLLARTGTADSGHKGLSLFIVEKPRSDDQYHFKHTQPEGGTIEGHAIPTIGYRGMHSFSMSFDNYFVPEENRIGAEGQGFYLQMQGFAGGRIQTAARAVGVMEAAFRSAINYTKSRKLFGRALAGFPLTQYKLGKMAASIQANRQLTYAVAGMMDNESGSIEASLVKLLACRDAEWVTREAMQLHGGMGYSEEYPVSRYFLDARVLSIFEGAEEVLAVQVIARPFLQKFLDHPVTSPEPHSSRANP